MIRDDLEATMRAKLGGAAPLDATILFDLGADGMIYVDGNANPPTIAEKGASPNTTITVSATDLRDMLAGDLNPMEAFTLGTFQISGDMGPAMRLSSLLG